MPTENYSTPASPAISPVDAALSYAARGWQVFPCCWIEDGACSCGDPACGRNSGKHPLVKWSTAATTDAGQITAWWERWPKANVAIATGARSGIIVIDLDKKPGKDGVASLGALCRQWGRLPPTLMVRTGSGGVHLYFAHPGGTVRNSTGELGPGIDVRGDGGYVLAPPSNHVSGGHYAN